MWCLSSLRSRRANFFGRLFLNQSLGKEVLEVTEMLRPNQQKNWGNSAGAMELTLNSPDNKERSSR
jgi:hypothetical protein